MPSSKETYKAIFGEEYQKPSYNLKPHTFKHTITGKQYCHSCGLVRLNNKFSQWAIDKGCLNEYHPDYQKMRKTTRPL